MASPTDRIAQIERELAKYSAKKAGAKTLAAIGSNISMRIKILNDIQREFIDLRSELFYYDMVDYLGNVPVSTLKLSQCLSLSQDLEKASQKFRDDQDLRYLEHCEKLKKKIAWVGLNIIKETFKNHVQGDEVKNFYLQSNDEIKEKIRKCYFAQRMKDVEKSIRACGEDVEKNSQMLIMSEIIAYETVLGAEVDIKIHRPGTFGFHILVMFRGICTKKNHKVIKDMLFAMANRKSITKVDELFMSVTKQHYARYNARSIEI